MSWFNDTFGDSLNSLKGQITKITKEVWEEDDTASGEESESVKIQIKELEALCASKDLEIASLREENQKTSHRFQEELKFLRDENKKLRAEHNKRKGDDVLLDDDQLQKVCELENQLEQLKIERDHLEELQKDHQSNIYLVIQQRDSYKHELEKVKKNFVELEVKFSELLSSNQNENKSNSATLDDNMSEIQLTNDELINLRNIVEKLQIQIETYQNEKEETSKVIERHMVNSENLKEKIEKLMEEIKILNSEKESTELENQKLKNVIESLKSELNTRMEDCKVEQKKKCELEENVAKLTQMLEMNKVEYSNFKTDMEGQVKKLLKVFFANNTDSCQIHDNSISDSIVQIEKFWNNSMEEREKFEKTLNDNLVQIKGEIERLRNDNKNLETQIKLEVDKRNEMESNYKEEINLLENKCLELKLSEVPIIMNESNDIKKLDDNVCKLMETIESKNSELIECHNEIDKMTQEMNGMREYSSQKELQVSELIRKEGEFERKISELEERLSIEMGEKEKLNIEMIEMRKVLEEKCTTLEHENKELVNTCDLLQKKVDEFSKTNVDSAQIMDEIQGKVLALEKELEAARNSKAEAEKVCEDMKLEKLKTDNQIDHLKAEIIIKQSNVSELNGKLHNMAEELNKVQMDASRLKAVEEELNRWKEATTEIEIQREDLSAAKYLLETECANLRSEVESYKLRVEEMRKETESLVQPPVEETKSLMHGEAQECSEVESLRLLSQQQANYIASITYENNELKHHLNVANQNVIALNERLKSEEESGRLNNVTSQREANADKISPPQQHKRSKSDLDRGDEGNVAALRSEITVLKEALQRQLQDQKRLQEQYSVASEKEAHARKELERLRLHLIEIENYYTETIDEYKTKLNVSEEQLKNSSTFYTSSKVRDNQHLESLQSQIRHMTTHREDLQAKLSAAEDEVQKHKAALTSFHVVLEQFQQDKEREMKNLATKYETQLAVSERRLSDLQLEITDLNNQLSDAKTGLKAASRLGEQLEKKSEQIHDLEERMARMRDEMTELQAKSEQANQSSVGKVDKSLVKNLLVGYVTSQLPDRKSQVLRILMSVLDFDEEERSKVGLDNASQAGWLSNLLHPKPDSVPSSQSLSEAFIRFLEYESRPKPQLKLLPERTSSTEKPRSATSTPKPSLLLQELVLPTFNSPQSSESTILKDVLNDS